MGTSGEAAEAGRWALAIALGVLVIGIPVIASLLRWAFRGVGRGGQQPGLWWGRSLVVGDDNRVSTSKTTALIWTYSVAAALLSFLIARWLGHGGALHRLTSEGLKPQYAVLIGGPIGAAILAKGIVSSQVSSGSAAKTDADSPTPAQLVQNDSGNADLGDVQYLLFNVVALVFFYGELLRVPQLGMPTIPDVLVGLTSVSAVGFVSKKALAGPAGISDVKPQAAHVGEPVTIATAGIIQGPDDTPGVDLTFGDAAASPVSVTNTASLGVLVVAPVPPDAAGQVDITVSVPNANPSTSPTKFKVIPRIAPGQNLVGRREHPVPVQTSGVTGLGPQLPGLSVLLGGVPARAALSDAGELMVTIPTSAPAGETKLTLATPGGADEAPIRVIE